MNWKLVATLFVGSALLTACAASNSATATPSDTRKNGIEAAPGAGATPPAADPAIAPAAAPAPTQEAKKPIVIHD